MNQNLEKGMMNSIKCKRKVKRLRIGCKIWLFRPLVTLAGETEWSSEGGGQVAVGLE